MTEEEELKWYPKNISNGPCDGYIADIERLESRVRELEEACRLHEQNAERLEAERDEWKKRCEEEGAIDKHREMYKVALAVSGRSNILETELVELRARHEALVKLVTKIAQPISCGCNPCTGDCVSQNALQIYLDEIKAECKAALAEVKP
jgi:predicted RNase H-like nuclease (RuvC/YqgF family)